MPDEKMVEELKSSIEIREKKLQKVEKDIDKLVQSYLDGVFTKDEIASKKSQLLGNKTLLENDLESLKDRLDKLPDIKLMELEAERIRRGLMDHYKDIETFQRQSYNHKRQFLHWLFDSDAAPHEHPHGIYLTKRGDTWDFTLWRSFYGTMTIYQDRVDIPEHDLPNDVFKQYLTNFVSFKHP